MWQLSQFHFDLPLELIARYPAKERSASRLLQVNSTDCQHRTFKEIIDLIHPGDLLVFNNTKVIPARLIGKKITGGKVEVLVERILDSKNMRVQMKASKPCRIGDKLYFDGQIVFTITDKTSQFYTLTLQNDQTLLEVIEQIGHIPLPPYLNRQPDDSDKERYQTVYAEHKGSIAAPTAGFHFDEALLAALKAKGVQAGFLTLHIGAGTFAPVRVDNINEHKMHAEYLEISQSLCEQIRATKRQGKRVISVGTTALRALETASANGTIQAFAGDTSIFIYPGYQFNCADALITNFHLPSSTLMMLVCAFGGYERTMQAYREAVNHQYHFYSYGDAMFLERAP